jgi:formylglycine-generating enzyme required for sulfatase activity
MGRFRDVPGPENPSRKKLAKSRNHPRIAQGFAMAPTKLFAVVLALASLVQVALATVTPINCNIFFDGTNTVQIAWNAFPGQSYVIQTTTNLTQPWQSSEPFTAISNAIYQPFPMSASARFFKVVKLDTDGPEVYKTSPFDGAIGVSSQATLQAWLRDETGINTNSIVLTIGTNTPVRLSDPRLSFSSGLLNYSPGTNEFLGTNGEIVAVSFAAADTLGNQTTNSTWSFQLSLAPLLTTNVIFLGPKGGGPCNLALVATNNDYFTFTYNGSCCLTNGTQLVNTNLYTGYTRTVVSFTDYPGSNTVVALTRPTKLAELLQAGTLSPANFVELTNSPGTRYHQNDLGLNTGFPLQHSFNLGHVLYQDANLLVETTPDSRLDLSATLQLAANFHGLKLTQIQAEISGTMSFELDVHAKASASKDSTGTVPLITPLHNIYGAFIGPVPVWLDVVFEVNAGYSGHFGASAEVTEGINALKNISVGKKWDSANGWADIYDLPPATLAFSGPTWQIEGLADLRAYLQPKVSVLIYSAAGVTADLEPYLELAGSSQLNPPLWDLSLYAGLDSTIGLDLSVWDDSWGALPSIPLHLIPQQTLWHAAGPPAQAVGPQIISQPQNQSVPLGSTISFAVQAQGSGTFVYRWYKNGLYLTDDTRITGSSSSTLRIANVQSSDAGNYSVRVINQVSSAESARATLTILGPPQEGMALIPAGSFTMGNCMNPSEGGADELPLHTVYLSAFYMDKYLVTKALWDTVYQWALSHGYSFAHAGSGKAANHPVQAIDWYDCVKWCNARSEKEGRVPGYYMDAGFNVRYRTGQVEPYVNWSSGYRLPTEAEWEKGARGGLSGHRFPWGDTIDWSCANYYAAPGSYSYDINPTSGYDPVFNDGVNSYTSPVGYFAPNGCGLYDMAGNVLEWCWDWYGVYGSTSQTDPRGPASGSVRVFRGGGWSGSAWDCRSADRLYNVYPSQRFSDVGFRVVRAPGQP